MRKLTSNLIWLTALILTGCSRPSEAPDAAAASDASESTATASSVSAGDSSSPVSLPPKVQAPPPVISDAQIEAEISAEMSQCLSEDDAARGVTPAMAACIHAELDAQDARLNAVYKSVMATLDGAGQARLRDEERTWIRDRDEECEALATGGTIDRIEIPSCLLNETIRRRLILEAMVP